MRPSITIVIVQKSASFDHKPKGQKVYDWRWAEQRQR